ncbi:MAG TPA: BamA/TamA family outer membrane protein [Planctomycetota bacterium]|nr:BamA/TamA family outer membrane protein [Planctomycetota bacterium]
MCEEHATRRPTRRPCLASIVALASLVCTARALAQEARPERIGLVLRELRFGYARIAGEVDADLIVPVQGFHFDDGVVEAKLLVDTLDEGTFPTSGVRSIVIWTLADEALGADVEYQKLAGACAGYVSADRTTVGVGISYETALDKTLPFYRAPGLGGFTRLSGLDPGSIGGQHAGLFVAFVRQRIAGRRAELFGFPVYVGATFEAGNVWADREDVFDTFRIAGSLFAAVDTPLGPTFFAYGQAEGGAQAFYLFVGQPF